ncbi:MAG: WD40 repeat domain-containing protein, partial [Blastopirellula sp. JB062]
TLRGHLDVVSSAQWSQNGKTLISGSVDQHLRYWDYESYRDQLTIDHDSSVLSVAYSSDGRLAATGDSGGGVRIFQPDQLNGGDVFYLREGDWLAESRATEFGAQFVGPNHLVTQIGGVNAAVWQLDSTRLVDSFPIGGQSVAIAAAPDGQRYALQDGEASLLRIRDFAGQETTIAQPAKAWGLDFSPSGNQIAVAKLVMASIYATSPADDPLIWKRAVNGVKQIAFLDESVVAVGGARGTDGGVMLLEVGTGRRLGDFSAEEGESYQSFVLSPDRSRIAALFRIGEEAEHRIKVWHTNSELLASASITDEVRSLGFTADGYLLLAGDHDVLLWNLNDKPQSIPGIAAAAKQSGRKIGGAVASPQNGDELAVYYENRDVEIWNASAGRRQRLNSARPVVYVGFSKDDTEVVAVHRDGLVRRWNAGDGSKIGQWTTRCNHVTSAALRDDRLVIAGDDGEVTMINWKTGKPTAKTKLDSAALDLAWTDQRIIAACGDGRLRLLSGENVQPVGQPFGEHGGSYLGVAIDSDEQRLAAVSSDRKVRVWLEVDLTAEKVGEPLVHEGHSAAVNSVAFSTDGRRLVTGSSDSMVIVWYVDRPETDQPVLMREIMPLRGHQKGITAIKFSPQTTDLMTAGDDGRATVWFGVDWKKEQNAPQPTAAAEQEP